MAFLKNLNDGNQSPNLSRIVGGLSPAIGMVAQAAGLNAEQNPNGLLAKALKKWAGPNKMAAPVPQSAQVPQQAPCATGACPYAPRQASQPNQTIPAHNRPQTANNQPQTAYNRPQPANNQPQTAYNRPQPANNQPQTAYNRPYKPPQTAYNRPAAQAAYNTKAGGCAAKRANLQNNQSADWKKKWAPQQAGQTSSCNLRSAVAAQTAELGWQAGNLQDEWNYRQQALNGSSGCGWKSAQNEEESAGPAPFRAGSCQSGAAWEPQQPKYQSAAQLSGSSCGRGNQSSGSSCGRGNYSPLQRAPASYAAMY
jgi:hypothetical protein